MGTPPSPLQPDRLIRVLVVDDSATMRGLIGARLRSHGRIEVVGGASDPYEAREAIKALNPDVITLDVEMPKMDGLAFLEKLMRLRPMPVVMVSTLTEAGAVAAVRALELGAFDCISKPGGNSTESGFDRLNDVVVAAAESRRIRPAPRVRRIEEVPTSYTPTDRLVAIGSSTGGVEALTVVLSGLPANCPPIVITQHMPPRFTESLAKRLNGISAPTVVEAKDGDVLRVGHVYIAPGGTRHLEVVNSPNLSLRLRAGDPVNGHRPSVDVLFSSVAAVYGSDALGVILTGMGRDGAAGLLEMRNAGATTFGQDESSCVVYGMPRAALEMGAVERQLPLEDIASAILKAPRATRSRKFA